MLPLITIAQSLAALPYEVSVSPCGANSFRVRIGLTSPPPATKAAQEALSETLAAEGLDELPGAFVCGPLAWTALTPVQPSTSNGNLGVTLTNKGSVVFQRRDAATEYFSAEPELEDQGGSGGYLQAKLALTAGSKDEKIYGLGQGEWDSAQKSCPKGEQKAVPLARNGQVIDLLQTKFHITIPTAFSSAGYGFVFNMLGYGNVSVGAHGIGGMTWVATHALHLDFWVSGLPPHAEHPMRPLFAQYADATGHAPMLREDAMLFWQSRNRYKSSAIALDIADKYGALRLPVGILVIDFENQVHDGDFEPNPSCYPSVKDLADGVRSKLNATTVFSFWPEVESASAEYKLLNSSGCLITRTETLGGFAIEATKRRCREMIWSKFLKPRYYDQGVTAYWLDEVDGEGTNGSYNPFGSGYLTQYGPPAFASNVWVNQYISMFTDPVKKMGVEPPLVLVRAVWSGGQRHGVVLWSSDIESNFETLAAMVPQGVHASMSGIPWWTTDVGGYGCNGSPPNDGPYMRELIVRWYQFGLFCPVFRTHGCRNGTGEPDAGACHPAPSCGFNEVWSYGADVQKLLEKYVRVRATTLLPYIRELAANVSAYGVPTMRPLAYEFPGDNATVGVNDQYMLGPDLLVAPVVTQTATGRPVYFPCEGGVVGKTRWQSFWDSSIVVACGSSKSIAAPLETIPVYRRS